MSSSLKSILDKFTSSKWEFNQSKRLIQIQHDVAVHGLHESPEFRCSSKVSKSYAATVNIPSGINVLEEDISKNPEFYIMVKSALFRRKAGNQLTPGQSWICSRTSNTSIGVLRGTSKIE